MKINIEANCNNAPKKEFLRDFNIAFAKGDTEFISKCVSEDILWVLVGDKVIKGKENFDKAIYEMKDYTADSLSLHSIITHGKEAAVNGEFKMQNNTYSFCDIYEFRSAGSKQIKTMRSYVIKTVS